MNEFKGTPGPWDFSYHIQPNGCPTVGHKGLMVCMVAHSVKEPGQKETALANAALISAAPDLLSDLKEAAQLLRNYEKLHREKGTEDGLIKADMNRAWAEQFEATISKATSNSN